jgi:hypothetical protein
VTDLATKIASLEEAAASGKLTVESDGDRVTYRSMADLLAAIGYFRAQQATAVGAGGVARPASTLAIFDPR